MEHAAAIVVASLGLALGSVLLHYEALRGISYVVPALAIRPRQKILVVINLLLLAHLLEIALYSAAFAIFLKGDVRNAAGGHFVEQAIYISCESFASLGTSAGFPTGPLRLLASSEALVGLILIGWTTSYTFLAMRDLWGEH